MRPPNAVFHLLARGLDVPQGWGFPAEATPYPGLSPAAAALRAALLPLTDTEGVAQLLRWHHALLRSRPHIWRSLAGEIESYHAGMIYKPVLELPGAAPAADPDGGFLTVNWRWAGETDSLSAAATLLDAQRLELRFGSVTATATYTAGEGELQRIRWPEWMATRAALKPAAGTWVPGHRFRLAVRVRGFEPRFLVERAGAQQVLLQRAGLLDSFLAAVNPLDRLAVAWLAVATLEGQP